MPDTQEKNSGKTTRVLINTPRARPDSKGKLIRKLIVFQVKLAIDGLRDLILSPLSLIAAIFGIITNPKNPSWMFEELMRAGHQTDRWINLFNAYDDKGNDLTEPKTIDDVVDSIETAIRKDIDTNGYSATAKAAVNEHLQRHRNQE
ncbi:MAG: hypothetical protein JKY49_00630 [Cohaesibacteraceae bacterium]|nr:hypothetical protein [Cohaesibacteraceae bacterium]